MTPSEKFISRRHENVIQMPQMCLVTSKWLNSQNDQRLRHLRIVSKTPNIYVQSVSKKLFITVLLFLYHQNYLFSEYMLHYEYESPASLHVDVDLLVCLCMSESYLKSMSVHILVSVNLICDWSLSHNCIFGQYRAFYKETLWNMSERECYVD